MPPVEGRGGDEISDDNVCIKWFFSQGQHTFYEKEITDVKLWMMPPHIEIFLKGCNDLIDWKMKSTSEFTLENLSFTEFLHFGAVQEIWRLRPRVVLDIVEIFMTCLLMDVWLKSKDLSESCERGRWQTGQQRVNQTFVGADLENKVEPAELVNKDMVSRNLCRHQNLPGEQQKVYTFLKLLLIR